jgi:hypothetical protein
VVKTLSAVAVIIIVAALEGTKFSEEENSWANYGNGSFKTEFMIRQT